LIKINIMLTYYRYIFLTFEPVPQVLAQDNTKSIKLLLTLREFNVIGVPRNKYENSDH